MKFDSFTPHHFGRWSECATHPIELRWGTLAALLFLAGIGPQRRPALPAHPITVHTGVFNCRI